MCIAPSNIDFIGLVGCRKCWQCKKQRIQDIAGRCIAEKEYSQKTLALTLTYADDAGVNAAVLQYKDVQEMLYRLRKHFEVRYLCAGEYGTKKGRAHWHIVLFFKSKKGKKDYPQEPLDTEQVMWEYWPHGYTYFQEPQYEGIEYVVKYAIKDQEQRSVHGQLTMSKFGRVNRKTVSQPLGYQYFEELAETYVENGITPQDYGYKFDWIKDYKGRTKRFVIQGTSRQNFMEHFDKKWREKWNTEPNSEIYDLYQDTLVEHDPVEKYDWVEADFLPKGGYEYPTFTNDEQTKKRLEYKPVKYVTSDAIEKTKPSFTDGEIIELEYQGENLLIYQYGDIFEVTQKTTEFYEGTYLEGIKKWRVKDEQQKKQIIEHGQIKGRAIYADLLREKLQ